jgi:hypothetical protein
MSRDGAEIIQVVLVVLGFKRRIVLCGELNRYRQRGEQVHCGDPHPCAGFHEVVLLYYSVRAGEVGRFDFAASEVQKIRNRDA